jgi:hypothetical protein
MTKTSNVVSVISPVVNQGVSVRTDVPSILNEFRIGDEVQASKQLVTWFASNLNFCYLIPDEREIRAEALKDCYFWLVCHNTRRLPKGRVIVFGSEEDFSDRKYVGVEFKIGRRKKFTFVHEKDLTKVANV